MTTTTTTTTGIENNRNKEQAAIHKMIKSQLEILLVLVEWWSLLGHEMLTKKK